MKDKSRGKIPRSKRTDKKWKDQREAEAENSKKRRSGGGRGERRKS